MGEDLLGSIARKEAASIGHTDVSCTNHNTDNFQTQALHNDQSQALSCMTHKLSVESGMSGVCLLPHGISKNIYRVLRVTESSRMSAEKSLKACVLCLE